MENLSIKVEIRTGVDDLHALCLIFAFLLGDFDLDLANLNRWAPHSMTLASCSEGGTNVQSQKARHRWRTSPASGPMGRWLSAVCGYEDPKSKFSKRTLKVSFILPLWSKTREKRGRESRWRIEIGEGESSWCKGSSQRWSRRKVEEREKNVGGEHSEWRWSIANEYGDRLRIYFHKNSLPLMPGDVLDVLFRCSF